MLNKEMKINMVKYKDEDEGLMKEVKKETGKDEERKQLQIEQDGFKRFNGLIFIPRSMEGKIIERYHDSLREQLQLREGHQGETRTAEKIQRYLYFPGMSRKIRISENATNVSEERSTQGNRLDLTMDFVSVPEKEGMGQILVVTDRFTKFSVLIPVKKTLISLLATMATRIRHFRST